MSVRVSRWSRLLKLKSHSHSEPSRDERCGVGVECVDVREIAGEELGSDCGRGGRRLSDDAVGDGKCAAERSDRRSGSGVVTRMCAPNCGELATSNSASKSRSNMFFLENAGVGRGAGSSNSSGAGVLTILPNSLSSWRPSFLSSFALVRSRSFGRSSDGVGEAGARSSGSGGAVLRWVWSLMRVGVRGGGCALFGAGGGGQVITSSVGRCRGRGSDCDLYVRETTSSAGYITYIPGETASRRPLAPSEEDYARRLSFYSGLWTITSVLYVILRLTNHTKISCKDYVDWNVFKCLVAFCVLQCKLKND